MIFQEKPRSYQGEVVEANQKEFVLEIGFFGKDHVPGGPFVYTIGHFRPLENVDDHEKRKKTKTEFVQNSWRVGQDVVFEMLNMKLDLVHKVQKKKAVCKMQEKVSVKSESDWLRKGETH